MIREVDNYIGNSNPGYHDILKDLRKLILSISPDVKEQFKWSRPVYRVDKDFCYLKTTKKYVTLGFLEFDKIKTNKAIIEGSGKSMRHIKLSNVEEIDSFEVEKMLREVLS